MQRSSPAEIRAAIIQQAIRNTEKKRSSRTKRMMQAGSSLKGAVQREINKLIRQLMAFRQSRKWRPLVSSEPAKYLNEEYERRATRRAQRWLRANPGQVPPGHIQAKIKMAQQKGYV